MSSLNRREELAVPNWPFESITTGIASMLPVVTPRMPAAKNEVCGPQAGVQLTGVVVPIRMTPLSPEIPGLPI